MNFKSDVEALDALRNKFGLLTQEISKVIYGQDEIVTRCLFPFSAVDMCC